jgi:hypothetical protein
MVLVNSVFGLQTLSHNLQLNYNSITKKISTYLIWRLVQSFDFPTDTLFLEQPLIKDKKLMTLRSQRKNRDVNWELNVSEAKNSIKKMMEKKNLLGMHSVFGNLDYES